MFSTYHRTAILIFANSATEDAKQKAIPNTDTLFRELTKHTLREVQKTNIPYFHYTEKEQTGNSFGERFTNAIQSVFDLGFERIITIGNDTPQLKATHLVEAEKALRENKTVLGPSLDGGFYLMGLHKSNFDIDIFKRLPWQRFSLWNRISDVLKNTDCSIHSLPVLSDIDSLSDIQRLNAFRKSISKTLLKILSLLLKGHNNISNFFLQFYFTLTVHRLFNKGSPAVLHF
ncbi:TIGR04282 family arsenosugar biosynthesis glycosyltransferase [Costertonia aggregata]|uniref:DUF2064 domain-containing protein n=1 Tax=Costertonia aggregata TaxID=343403 RepID=A0A7H9AP55_9FLAO|nr:DUF2064 domain-containing protein [Costertonia aggregata]QLG45222.1 DUF2064 domain-containing protein [Costertonia aggregata]